LTPYLVKLVIFLTAKLAARL